MATKIRFRCTRNNNFEQGEGSAREIYATASRKDGQPIDPAAAFNGDLRISVPDGSDLDALKGGTSEMIVTIEIAPATPAAAPASPSPAVKP
jgi:hypothetical protein